MASVHELSIEIGGVSGSEAEKYAAELKEKLLDVASGIRSVDIQSSGSNTQDGGALLVAVLSAPFAIELAKGIARAIEALMIRRERAVVTITKPDRTKVRISSASADAASIVRSLTS